jgi:hypothetical protein
MKSLNEVQSFNANNSLQNDNVFVNVEMVNLQQLTGIPTTSRFNQAIVSEGKIVNVVSGTYGLLKNEDLFLKVEEAMIEADMNYVTRSINRNNASFAVDYILDDENWEIKIKGTEDKIQPMLRYTNSYDGGPTSGRFGFFRKICTNGLTIAQTKAGFSVRHKSTVTQVVLPKIDEMVKKFMDNEFYSLHRKFNVLAESTVTDMNDFVKMVCKESELFMYEASEKNPEPSANARYVLDIINNEARALDMQPNMWLGYNAFNEILHNKMKRSFVDQQRIDTKLFNLVVDMAGAN